MQGEATYNCRLVRQFAIMTVVWGIAGMAVGALMELHFLGRALDMDRLAAYSVGFLVLWAFAAASSAFTCFLQRSAGETNRCPLPRRERPERCPEREDPDAAC